MSPNSVNDLASSFVQMAKAFEELPAVQEELTATQACLDEARSQVELRELAIVR